MTEMHRADFFARRSPDMSTGNSTAYVRPPVSGGEEVDRAEIRAAFERAVTIDPRCDCEVSVLAVAIKVATERETTRELVSRQEIDRLRAENERLKIRIDAAAQVAFMAVRGFSADPPEVAFRMILSLLDGKHENARGVSEIPEAGR